MTLSIQEKNVRSQKLKEIGFSKEVITKIREFTSRAFISVGAIEARINHLKNIGFINPISLIKNNSSVLGFASATIDAKLAHLRECGFENPVPLIETCVNFLSFAPASIDAKLVHLRKLGFTDLISLTEKRPEVLSLAQNKVSLTVRLLQLVEKDDLERGFLGIIAKNIESLILASLGTASRSELVKSAKAFKGISTTEKRMLIYERMHTLDPEIQKLYQERYGVKEA